MKIIFLFILSSSLFAEEKIIYKYKTYEKFDLSNLEVKGDLIAPGDLSVEEKERRVFFESLYERQSFYNEWDHQIINDR